VLDPRKTPISEIMATDVQTIDADATIQEVLETLEDYGISGAPVVDATGRCVGVFSTTDLARREQEIQEGDARLALGWYDLGPLSDRFFAASEDLETAQIAREVVGDWMTREVKSVGPGTSVQETARIMVEEAIHRVLVMEGKKLAGIVSALDIAAFVAGEGEAPAKARATKTRKAKAKPARKAKARR
jgi:CBS domain-containing protein